MAIGDTFINVERYWLGTDGDIFVGGAEAAEVELINEAVPFEVGGFFGHAAAGGGFAAGDGDETIHALLFVIVAFESA